MDQTDVPLVALIKVVNYYYRYYLLGLYIFAKWFFVNKNDCIKPSHVILWSYISIFKLFAPWIISELNLIGLFANAVIIWFGSV